MALWHLSLLPVQLIYDSSHDLAGTLKLFRADFAGYILSSSPSGAAGPGGDNGPMYTAISLAGVLRAVVATPETQTLAEAAGLPMLLDARKMRLEEAFERHRHGARAFSKTLLFNQHHANLIHTTDFAVYARAFTLYDSSLTMPLSQRALSRLRPVSLVLGWADEVEFVAAASRHGHQVLCSDHTTNLPVYSNFAPPPSKSPPPPPPPRQQQRGSSPPPFPPAPTLQPEPLHASENPALTSRTRSEGSSSSTCSAAAADTRHVAVFMFTDGDSVTWTNGRFASADFDWCRSSSPLLRDLQSKPLNPKPQPSTLNLTPTHEARNLKPERACLGRCNG